MHQGNVGFQLADRGPLPLSPAYDMLPMSLAPTRTGVLRPAAPLGPIAPERAGQLAHLQWAAPLAAEYWQSVAASPAIRSNALRELATQNGQRGSRRWCNDSDEVPLRRSLVATPASPLLHCATTQGL